jgi:hypothetical protein
VLRRGWRYVAGSNDRDDRDELSEEKEEEIFTKEGRGDILPKEVRRKKKFFQERRNSLQG